MTHQAVGSSFANGARIPNWVNGRLLTAEDLATERDTLLGRDTLIGQAAGYGVVSGLWVSGGGTRLGITSGLGLNRQGNPIRLGADTSLGLVLTAPASAPTDTGRFANCTLTPSTTTSIAAGAYLLTALPTSQFEGQAPLNRPPGQQSSPGCVSQWEVEGVGFKAIRLGVDMTGSTVTEAIRRSLLAHWCFGSARLSGLGVDPFHFDAAYTGLDQIDPADLTPCDLPLAVFYWTGSTVGFVDNWPARRRIVRDDPRESAWAAAISDKRLAEGRARFFQFQQQVDDLVATGAAGVTSATDVFEYLPPAGFLPVKAHRTRDLLNRLAARPFLTRSVRAPGALLAPFVARTILVGMAAGITSVGFDIETFFKGMEHVRFGGLIRWDDAELTLQQSWREEAFAVTAGRPLFYYFVEENFGSPRPYIFFAKPLHPVAPVAQTHTFVGMAGSPSGQGYWLVASDGSVFPFGDAGFHGSPAPAALKGPVVGMAPTPSGRGYWLVDAGGGIFNFGDATFFGSADGHLNSPIVGMAATPTGGGYWLPRVRR
jgi:hypothetical protein